jgi:CRISPR type I-E-associated protein CasB/Cse2
MESQNDKITDSLIAKLERKYDPEALAGLRYALHSDAQQKFRARRWIAELMEPGSPHRGVYETVAGLWARYPDSPEPGVNFGAACRDSGLADMYFERLIESNDCEELCARIAKLGSAPRIIVRALDYDQLFQELVAYEKEEELVRIGREWALAFWSDRIAEGAE